MKMPAPPTDHIEHEIAPAGSHIAVCSRVIDIGSQTTRFQNETRLQRKIYIEFQLSHELNSHGHPFTVGNRYTFSSSPKAILRQHLESWRGKTFTDQELEEFDLKNILAKTAVVTCIHTVRNGKTYVDLSTISAIPKGTPAASLTGEPVILSLEPDAFDHSVYQSLSDRLRDVIAKSPEFAVVAGQ